MTYARAIREWRENPCRFVWDNFKVEPDRWQVKALKAFASKDKAAQRIALRACAGPGKTAVLAWMGLNFLTCYGSAVSHPKGAAISISADNLRDNLWAEFAKWIARADLMQALFHLTATRLFAKDHEKERFISARSFAKTANADEAATALAGLHADDLLYLIDESGNIPPSVLRSAEQGINAAPGFAKVVQAGNPTSTSGMLYQAATVLAHEWTNIRITADPDDPDRTPRVSKEAVQAQIDNYGRANPWIKSFYLGEFPDTAINTLLSVEEVEAAMRRNIHPSTYEGIQKRLGVDVARFGTDATVIYPRQGLQAFDPVEMRGARSNIIAARIAQAKLNWGEGIEDVQEFIDDTGGFGSGVVDQLLTAGHNPTAVNFSESAPETQYANIRAYMWFKCAEWVKRGGGLPRDEQLKKELTAPTYFFKNGRFQLESKDQVKARLNFSPDRADALALTFAMPDQPAPDRMPIGFKQKKVKHDYDPFERA